MDVSIKRYIPFKFKRLISIATLLLIAVTMTQATARLSAQAPAATQASSDEAKFIKLYPGVFTEKEKALAKKYLADNKTIADRGPVDVQALIHGTLPKETPGIAAVLPVTEAMVRYNNNKYDPENPVLNDAEYAKKLGYENIFAFLTFAASDDLIMTPFPGAARDKLTVSQLNHNITAYKPIYPGDTLYTVINARDLYDITPPEGSTYRDLVIVNQASVYNQKGEKVQDVTFRVMESIKVYKDGMAPANPDFMRDIWTAPNWMTRPAHKYTDKDWETIKGIWSKEKRQGATPLYWEDVKIGDQPAWTLDGPIMESVMPTKPYGQGAGGSRTMKKEIMDPAIFKTMIRDDATGIYVLPNKADYVPAVPDQKPEEARPAMPKTGDGDTKDIHKQTESRAVLINYFGRDLAIRNIDNWMGDHGTITNIRWGIMEAETHAAFGVTVPKSPYSEDFLAHVPFMKGKHVNAHGLTSDVAIIKSYVYNKYVKSGEFYVDLTWWVESIDGYIWEAGGATVKLPSKNVN
jgi:acyl dehydratase